jgi:hypothetical protein
MFGETHKQGRLRLLPVALVLSFLGNVVLLVKRGASEPPRDVAEHPTRLERRPLLPPPVPSTVVPAVTADCSALLSALQMQKTTIAEQIEQHRPLEELFARGDPNPTATAELKQIVERILAAGESRIPFAIDCRGSVCDLTIPPEVTPPDNWQRRLHRSVEFAARAGDRFNIGRNTLMFPLRERTQGESKAALVNLVRGFKDGPALDNCWASHKEEGRLDAAVWIGHSEYDEVAEDAMELPNGVFVWTGGKLAGTPGGRCVVESFKQAALATATPAHRAYAIVHTFFDLPPRHD